MPRTASVTMLPQSNAMVAAHLDEIAALLEAQGANVFRSRAYRRAAETIRELKVPVIDVLRDEGLEGLDALPNIGPSIARVVREFLTTGGHGMLDRLRGAGDAVTLLGTVPGVGPKLAQRLHDLADIDTLEQLETAAHDGRLERIPGFGPKRVSGIRDTLSTRLGRPRRAAAAARLRANHKAPSITELLSVDQEYLVASRAGRLPRVAPKRFNPDGTAWLPVLHTTRGSRHYTALFSNTALAHQLQRTTDWVVLYFDGADGEHQHTVVTATSGSLRGKRVVRGREPECEEYYADRKYE